MRSFRGLALPLAVAVARLFDIAVQVRAGVGAATVAWAGMLTVVARCHCWRRSLGIVAVANAGATTAIVALGLMAPAVVGRLLLLAVAVDVGTFAVVQVAAPPRPSAR